MSTDYFWAQKPDLTYPKLNVDSFLNDKRLFEYQMDALTKSILLNDYANNLTFYSHMAPHASRFAFINKGEIIAGSSICRLVNPHIDANDIDIYLHSAEDAMELLRINNLRLNENRQPRDLTKYQVCCSVYALGTKINLIWGIEYKDAEDLISRFDIRACSMALDPNSSTFTVLSGAFEDTMNRQIHFNMNPRSVSVARLLKYVSKGFTLDKYQRVVFAELIKNGYHSNELELTTGYGGNL